MTILKENLPTACPDCDCPTVCREEFQTQNWDSSGSINQHCNGQRWERRYFTCGCMVEWCPNFEQWEKDKHRPCKKTQAYMEKQEKCRALEAIIRKHEDELRELRKS